MCGTTLVDTLLLSHFLEDPFMNWNQVYSVSDLRFSFRTSTTELIVWNEGADNTLQIGVDIFLNKNIFLNIPTSFVQNTVIYCFH